MHPIGVIQREREKKNSSNHVEPRHIKAFTKGVSFIGMRYWLEKNLSS